MVTAATDSVLSSKTRWTIVGLLSASIAINLLDRQIFSVLAPLLRETFTWSNTQYGYAAVAFNLGMMLGQVPAGALMDRVGTKHGLLVIFLGWSLLTAMHALAGPGTAIDSIGSLFALPFVALVASLTFTTAPILAAGLSGFIFLRFLLGLFQCGNYTAGIKSVEGRRAVQCWRPAGISDCRPARARVARPGHGRQLADGIRHTVGRVSAVAGAVDGDVSG